MRPQKHHRQPPQELPFFDTRLPNGGGYRDLHECLECLRKVKLLAESFGFVSGPLGIQDLATSLWGRITLVCLRWLLYGFYHGKSPSNHNLGEYFVADVFFG